MTDEIEMLNEWLESKAVESENYQNSISGSGNFYDYLRNLKDTNLKPTIEICQTMWSYNPNPLLDYIKVHENEYDILSPPTIGWITGSSTIYVKKVFV